MAVGDESVGFSAIVEIDDSGTSAGPGGSFTVVDKVVDFDVPSPKSGNVESKRLGLARLRKIATGVEDGGEVSIKVQFTHAGWSRMEAIRLNKQRNNWRFTIPDDNGNTQVTFVCLLHQNKPSKIEADKITEFEIMLTVGE